MSDARREEGGTGPGEPEREGKESRRCLSCGACCFSESPRYVRVMGDDYSRLVDALGEATTAELVWWEANRAWMRIADGHCAALRVLSGGAVEDGSFPCSVYDVRPAVCRELLRGSPACEAEILRKGEIAERRRRLPVAAGD